MTGQDRELGLPVAVVDDGVGLDHGVALVAGGRGALGKGVHLGLRVLVAESLVRGRGRPHADGVLGAYQPNPVTSPNGPGIGTQTGAIVAMAWLT